nr:hypothetical protein [Endozoicomonas sp.]
MWRNLSLPESVGVSGWLFTCGEYGMHSHAEHGNEVSGGFCDSRLRGDDGVAGITCVAGITAGC